jgi:hypothetical protein
MQTQTPSKYSYGTYIVREGKRPKKGRYLMRGGDWSDKKTGPRLEVKGLLQGGRLVVQNNRVEALPAGARWVKVRTPKNTLRACLKILSDDNVALEALIALGYKGVVRFLKTGNLKSLDRQPDVFIRFARMVREKGDFEEGARILFDWVASGKFPKEYSPKYLVSSNHTYLPQVVAGWVRHMIQEVA